MHLLGAYWVVLSSVVWWVWAGEMGQEGGGNLDSQLEILGIIV